MRFSPFDFDVITTPDPPDRLRQIDPKSDRERRRIRTGNPTKNHIRKRRTNNTVANARIPAGARHCPCDRDTGRSGYQADVGRLERFPPPPLGNLNVVTRPGSVASLLMCPPKFGPHRGNPGIYWRARVERRSFHADGSRAAETPQTLGRNAVGSGSLIDADSGHLPPSLPEAVDSRRLIAVVYADMAGYSRLIGEDDAGTCARLAELRADLIDPALARHGGRLVNTAGDSLLVLFDSILSAMRFAIEVQRAVPSFDGDYAPDRRMRFRMGVNAGDIVPDGTNMHGDGLNVAARLQSVCPIGAICVSRVVREQVGNRLGLPFKELGALDLKNIGRPVEAFVLDPRRRSRCRQSLPNRAAGSRSSWGFAVLALVVAGTLAWQFRPAHRDRQTWPRRRRLPARMSRRRSLSLSCRSTISVAIRSSPTSPTASPRT